MCSQSRGGGFYDDEQIWETSEDVVRDKLISES
jgi:hypothetical protein